MPSQDVKAKSGYPAAKPPTPLARRFVYYVLGFGISVVIGLLPFLGVVEVPGFAPLLSLFPQVPRDTTRTLIPISSFLMGVVCVVVQYMAEDEVKSRFIRKIFIRSTISVVIAAILLLVVHTFTVRQIYVPSIDAEVTVLVGYQRSANCPPCDSADSDTACLGKTTLDPEIITLCWDETAINISFLSLSLLYLVLTCGFGAMIGGLVLKERIGGTKRRS